MLGLELGFRERVRVIARKLTSFLIFDTVNFRDQLM